MLTLERYEIETTSGRIDIRINQRKNAIINILISTGLLGFTGYLIISSSNISTFYYVLFLIGGL